MNDFKNELSKSFETEIAEELYSVIRGNKAPEDYESVSKYIEKCFQIPKWYELTIRACNEILKGDAINFVPISFEDCEEIQALFVDRYNPDISTIIYDVQIHKWYCESIRDYGEQLQNSNELNDWN